MWHKGLLRLPCVLTALAAIFLGAASCGKGTAPSLVDPSSSLSPAPHQDEYADALRARLKSIQESGHFNPDAWRISMAVLHDPNATTTADGIAGVLVCTAVALRFVPKEVGLAIIESHVIHSSIEKQNMGLFYYSSLLSLPSPGIEILQRAMDVSTRIQPGRAFDDDTWAFIDRAIADKKVNSRRTVSLLLLKAARASDSDRERAVACATRVIESAEGNERRYWLVLKEAISGKFAPSLK